MVDSFQLHQLRLTLVSQTDRTRDPDSKLLCLVKVKLYIWTGWFWLLLTIHSLVVISVLYTVPHRLLTSLSEAVLLFCSYPMWTCWFCLYTGLDGRLSQRHPHLWHEAHPGGATYVQTKGGAAGEGQERYCIILQITHIHETHGCTHVVHTVI